MMHKRPRRRWRRNQRSGCLLPRPKTGESPCRLSGQCTVSICRTVKNRNWHQMKDLLPVLPLVNAGQIVRPHQPDEPKTGELSGEMPEGIGGIAGAETMLDIRHPDARMARHAFRFGHPGRKRSHAIAALERVLRCDHPPDLVEPQVRKGRQADLPVPVMGRIERTAEDPDLARDRTHAYGRTWPSPRTMYL